MDCPEVSELLHDALDERLDVRFMTGVNRHLETCPACAAEQAELQKLRALFTAMPPVEAPAGFRADVMANLPAGRVLPFPRWLGALAAVAAVLVVAIWVQQSSGRPTSTETAKAERSSPTAAADADGFAMDRLETGIDDEAAEELDAPKEEAGTLAESLDRSRERRRAAPTLGTRNPRAAPAKPMGGVARGDEGAGAGEDADDAGPEKRAEARKPAAAKKAVPKPAPKPDEKATAGGRPVPPPKPTGAAEAPSRPTTPTDAGGKARGVAGKDAGEADGETESKTPAPVVTTPTRYIVFADAAEARAFVAELEAVRLKGARFKAPPMRKPERESGPQDDEAKDKADGKSRDFRDASAEHEVLATIAWTRTAKELDPLIAAAERNGRAALIGDEVRARLRMRAADAPTNAGGGEAGGGGGAGPRIAERKSKGKKTPAPDEGPSTGAGAAPRAKAPDRSAAADTKRPTTVRVIVLIRTDTGATTNKMPR